MDGYDKFCAFLRAEGCFAAFERAFYVHNDFTHFDRQMWAAAYDKSSFLGTAFRWADTPEGRDYWSEIDKKWVGMDSQHQD